METIKIMFANARGTLFILGLLFLFMAIIGRIDTQWFNIDFSDLLQRGGLIFIGLLSILLGLFAEKLNPSTDGQSAKKSSKIRLLNGGGSLEWQWAAENWYGRLNVDELNNKTIITRAKVGLIQKTLKREDMEARIIMNGKILQLVPNSQGAFEFTKDGVNLDFVVQKKNRGSGQIVIENIKGFLREVPCYAGKVDFVSESGAYMGDIILVGYQSQLGSQVDNWFKNDQKWFE